MAGQLHERAVEYQQQLELIDHVIVPTIDTLADHNPDKDIFDLHGFVQDLTGIAKQGIVTRIAQISGEAGSNLPLVQDPEVWQVNYASKRARELLGKGSIMLGRELSLSYLSTLVVEAYEIRVDELAAIEERASYAPKYAIRRGTTGH